MDDRLLPSSAGGYPSYYVHHSFLQPSSLEPNYYTVCATESYNVDDWSGHLFHGFIYINMASSSQLLLFNNYEYIAS